MTDALQELYSQVPDANCKGLCHQACGPIEMGELERQQIREGGVEILPAVDMLVSGNTDCAALSPLGKCTVYEQRPMICRLYGVVETMRCEYGCKPDGGFLTVEQGNQLLLQSIRIGNE